MKMSRGSAGSILAYSAMSEGGGIGPRRTSSDTSAANPAGPGFGGSIMNIGWAGKELSGVDIEVDGAAFGLLEPLPEMSDDLLSLTGRKCISLLPHRRADQLPGVKPSRPNRINRLPLGINSLWPSPRRPEFKERSGPRSDIVPEFVGSRLHEQVYRCNCHQLHTPTGVRYLQGRVVRSCLFGPPSLAFVPTTLAGAARRGLAGSASVQTCPVGPDSTTGATRWGWWARQKYYLILTRPSASPTSAPCGLVRSVTTQRNRLWPST